MASGYQMDRAALENSVTQNEKTPWLWGMRNQGNTDVSQLPQCQPRQGYTCCASFLPIGCQALAGCALGAEAPAMPKLSLFSLPRLSPRLTFTSFSASFLFQRFTFQQVLSFSYSRKFYPNVGLYCLISWTKSLFLVLFLSFSMVLCLFPSPISLSFVDYLPF